MLNYCKECKCYYVFYCQLCELNKTNQEITQKVQKRRELNRSHFVTEIENIEKHLNENPQLINKLLSNLIVKSFSIPDKKNKEILDSIIWKDLKYEK